MAVTRAFPDSMRLLITGGAGFIGAHLVQHMLQTYPAYEIYNLDALNYAGDLKRLEPIADVPNYHFLHTDLSDKQAVDALFQTHNFTAVIHLAAESHVDRSIADPLPFLHSNVCGTLHLLEAARRTWQPLRAAHRFYHISTDEVYGSLGHTGVFTEDSPYRPRSPYSATKAAADHLVRAYGITYGLPTLISHASNNYGPMQYPEKLIPLALLNFIAGKPVPVYGTGEQVREWLYVADHVAAIDRVFHKGAQGETYHIGSGETHSNHHMLQKLAGLLAQELDRPVQQLQALIQRVADRPGHDFRYALSGEKLRKKLGWQPHVSLQEGLSRTISWYLQHGEWIKYIRTKSTA